MPDILRAAVVQFTAGPDVFKNLQEIERLVRAAAADGARLIATPENTCHIRGRMVDKLNSAACVDTHTAIPFFGKLARDLGVYILVGSVSVKMPSGKLANRSYMFDPSGIAIATYDKIHLFDATLPMGASFRESDVFEHGDRAVLTAVDDIKVGMTICYDVRFPHLYRTLAQAGAHVMTVPAAFAPETGIVHWHTLLRARAIENGVYVLAPAQAGTHEGGRVTYGHSLIVNPWGEIVGELGENEPGYLVHDLDMGAVRRTRQSIQSLQHDRSFTLINSF